jgi:hypothetical protein
VAVVAIAGDDTVLAGGHCRLQSNRDGLLADVKVAKAADEAEAVELARALLEAADHQHLAIEVEQLLFRSLEALGLRRALDFGSLGRTRNGRFLRGTRHGSLSQLGSGPAYRRRVGRRQPPVS